MYYVVISKLKHQDMYLEQTS